MIMLLIYTHRMEHSISYLLWQESYKRLQYSLCMYSLRNGVLIYSTKREIVVARHFFSKKNKISQQHSYPGIHEQCLNKLLFRTCFSFHNYWFKELGLIEYWAFWLVFIMVAAWVERMPISFEIVCFHSYKMQTFQDYD